MAARTLALALALVAAEPDARCADWAAAGECDKNPGYMRTQCKEACDVEEGAVARSFYELTAETADGSALDFASLKGKVVLVTNVASE